MSRLLILSDGKPGHVNQSRAFADLTAADYRIVEVRFLNRLCKGLSLLLDRVGIYSGALLRCDTVVGDFDTVVSAGSETYYANRVLAASRHARSIAVMLPRGYRYGGFDLIIAQEHDHPPRRKNILAVPINLCRVQPQGVFRPAPGRSYVGLIIGGPNKAFRMDEAMLSSQLQQIRDRFPDHDLVVATSRRTPAAVDDLLRRFPFAVRWIYADDPVNPIPDFITHCDYVFITADSTSMISEAVSFGEAAVEILPLSATGAETKFRGLVDRLQQRGCLHRFDGSVADCRSKIDLAAVLEGVSL